MNVYIKLWQDRIQTIESGETVISDSMNKSPYFGATMTKDDQLNFCNRMIEKLKENEKR